MYRGQGQFLKNVPWLRSFGSYEYDGCSELRKSSARIQFQTGQFIVTAKCCQSSKLKTYNVINKWITWNVFHTLPSPKIKTTRNIVKSTNFPGSFFRPRNRHFVYFFRQHWFSTSDSIISQLLQEHQCKFSIRCDCCLNCYPHLSPSRTGRSSKEVNRLASSLSSAQLGLSPIGAIYGSGHLWLSPYYFTPMPYKKTTMIFSQIFAKNFMDDLFFM